MADHDEFDATELASAYLDGEVSDVERARVEGDRALLDEVERLRQVRAALGDVPSAPPTSATASIAAALSVFDEQHAVADEQDTNVAPLAHRRRMRWMQGVTAAAAVAVIVVGGIVIANRRSEDEATTAREPSTERTEQTAPPVGGLALDAATAPAPAAPAAAPTTTVAPAVGEDASSELEQADEPLAAVVPTTSAAANVLGEAATMRQVITEPTELAELVESLPQPPPPLDEVLAACRAGQLDRPDAAVIGDDGTERAVALASTTDGSAAVLLSDCSIAMRSPTGPVDTDS
jgi:hypothetical protein